jgi:hypothetical protein
MKLILVVSFFLSMHTFSSNVFSSEKGVYVIDKEAAIKHVLGYEEYESIESVENEKLRRRIKRETQILTEKLEKFKFEAPNLQPSVKKVRQEELIKYGKALQALEKQLVEEKDANLEKHFKKIEKQWNKQSRDFFVSKKSKVVFLKKDGKLIYRGKGVTPLTIKVLKDQKDKEDITSDFIAHADKLAGRKPEPADEEESEEGEEEEVSVEETPAATSTVAPKN